MATTERVRAMGRRNAARVRQRLADELRGARIAAGVSQHRVADAAGVSQSHVSRAELAQAASMAFDELACHCAALGLRLDVRTFPVASPVRDAGQLRLIDRLRSDVHRDFRWATEVLVGGPGDYRAWDVYLSGPGTVGIDAETRLGDLQALQRRTEAKARDSGVDRVVLLVGGTRHNRGVLRDHREALRSTLPGDTAEVMAALRAGRLPGRSGLVVI